MIPTRLRVGRILLVGGSVCALLLGGTLWLLRTQATPIVQATSDTLGWRPKEVLAYPTTEPPVPKPAEPVKDPNAELLKKMAELQAEMVRQAQELEALKKRQASTTIVHPQQAAAAKGTPPARAPAPMLFVAHEVKETGEKSKEAEYTIMPGGYIPCLIATAMNSDTGDITFVADVSTTVYDTATGKYPLILQGSKIVGSGEGSTLVYGNELLRTVSLTLSRRQDTKPIDLGHAPVTDQVGINGLASRVDSHFWRNVGAVFIGGALRGGQQAIQTSLAQAGGAGQVAAGIGSVGSQVGQQRIGKALDTRPTIYVDAGQPAHVIVIKPLTLTVAR